MKTIDEPARATTRLRIEELRKQCDQERIHLEIMGRAHTVAEEARLALLGRALTAFDAALAALVFGEQLDRRLESASSRLDGPLGALLGAWAGPADAPLAADDDTNGADAAAMAGHAEARVRMALDELAALGAAVAAVQLPPE